MFSKQEIKQLKKQHGHKAVNMFVRFEAAKKRWKYLPNNFILSVLNNIKV